MMRVLKLSINRQEAQDLALQLTAVVVVLLLLTVCLTLHGWNILTVIVFSFVIPCYLVKKVDSVSRMTQSLLRLWVLCICVIYLLVVISAYKAKWYMLVTDPTLNLVGISVAKLDAVMNMHPELHSVICSDGFVHLAFEEFQKVANFNPQCSSNSNLFVCILQLIVASIMYSIYDPHTVSVVAPIYIIQKEAQLHGESPVAWAIYQESGNRFSSASQSLAVTHCPNAGVCGLLPTHWGSLQGRMVESDSFGAANDPYLVAANTSATAHGFKFRDSLPMLWMETPKAEEKRSIWWFQFLWVGVGAFVLSLCGADCFTAQPSSKAAERAHLVP